MESTVSRLEVGMSLLRLRLRHMRTCLASLVRVRSLGRTCMIFGELFRAREFRFVCVCVCVVACVEIALEFFPRVFVVGALFIPSHRMKQHIFSERRTRPRADLACLSTSATARGILAACNIEFVDDNVRRATGTLPSV